MFLASTKASQSSGRRVILYRVWGDFAQRTLQPALAGPHWGSSQRRLWALLPHHHSSFVISPCSLAQAFHNQLAVAPWLCSKPTGKPAQPGNSGSGQPRRTRNRSILGGQSAPLTPRRQPIPASTRCSVNTSRRSQGSAQGGAAGVAHRDLSGLLPSDWLWLEGTARPLAASSRAWAGWKPAC